MPLLKEFYEKHKDSLTIIGIANDNYQNWTAFLNKHNYNWIQLLDNGPIKLSEDLKVGVYPTKYLLDPSGKVIMIFKDTDESIWSKIEREIKLDISKSNNYSENKTPQATRYCQKQG